MISPFLISILFIFSVIIVGILTDWVVLAFSGLQKKRIENALVSPTKIPLYFAFGATIYSAYATILSISGVRLSVGKFIFLLLLLCLVNLFLYRNSLPRNFKSALNFKPLQIKGKDLIIGAAIIVLAILIALQMLIRVAYPSFDIDLLGHLLSKAKILLYTTYRDSLYFHDALFSNLHSKYPPMFGILYNLLFLFVGGARNSYFHVVNYFILFCIGYSVYVFLSNKIPRWQAAVWFLICISAKSYLQQLFIVDNADVMLSLFFLLAACELSQFFATQNYYHVLSLSFLISGGALLKSEGLFFALLAGGAFVFFVWQKSGYGLQQKRQLSLLFLVPTLLLLAPWWIYQLSLSSAESPIFINSLNQSLPYFKDVLIIYIQQLFSWNWQGIFIFWIILILFSWLIWQRKISLFSVLALALLFAYFLIIYIGQGKEVATLSWGVSPIKRTIAHCYPLSLVAVGLMVGDFLFKAK